VALSTSLGAAFATVEHHSFSLFSAIAKKSEKIVSANTTSLHSCTNLVWSLAMNGHASDRLFEVVGREVAKIVKGGDNTIRDVSNILWSFAISGKITEPVKTLYVGERAVRMKSEALFSLL